MVKGIGDYQIKWGEIDYTNFRKQFTMCMPELLRNGKLHGGADIADASENKIGGLDITNILLADDSNVDEKNFNRDYSKIKANSFYDVVKITGLPPAFIRFLMQKEGVIYKAKRGLAGNILIGVGHNCDLKNDYKKGDEIKLPEVYTLLARDLMYAKDKLHRALNGRKIPVGQECAAIDLMYNVGESVARSKFMKHLKNGNFDAAVAEIDYVSANGRVLPGLCVRRIDNIIQFCGGRLTDAGKHSVEKIYSKLKNATSNKQTLKLVKEKIEKASAPVDLIALKDKKSQSRDLLASGYFQNNNTALLSIDG